MQTSWIPKISSPTYCRFVRKSLIWIVSDRSEYDWTDQRSLKRKRYSLQVAETGSYCKIVCMAVAVWCFCGRRWAKSSTKGFPYLWLASARVRLNTEVHHGFPRGTGGGIMCCSLHRKEASHFYQRAPLVLMESEPMRKASNFKICLWTCARVEMWKISKGYIKHSIWQIRFEGSYY